MRTIIIGMLFMLVAGFCLPALADAPTYTLQVLNQRVEGTTFKFDVYIVHDEGDPLFLGNCDLVLRFTSANFSSSPAASATNKFSAIYTISPTVVDGNLFIVNINAPTPGDQEQFDALVFQVSSTAPGTRIGTFSLNTVTNTAGSAGLEWMNAGARPTLVTAFQSVDPWNGFNITNPAKHVPPDETALPVTMSSFNGRVDGTVSGVKLEWKTQSEVNNYGFTVQRKGENETVFADLQGAFIQGKGTTVEPQSYSYVDQTVRPGSWDYRLRQQDLDGTARVSQSVRVLVTLTDVAESAPKVFQLMQNYPNPFNPVTQVKFSVESSTRATLKVYNLLGEEVATLFDGTADAGRFYAVSFNGAGLASGMYFYRLATEKNTDVHKMMLVR